MKSFVYDRLSFLEYDLNRPCLDTEWLLSTLFDASLLSTSKPPATAGLFFSPLVTAFFFAVIPRRAIARLRTRVFAWTRNPAPRTTSGFRVRSFHSRPGMTRSWKPY